MAVATAPRTRRSLLGLAVDAARGRRPGGSLRVAAAAVRDHMTTAAALAAVDVGLFHSGFTAGWIGTGLSLLLLEFKIRG